MTDSFPYSIALQTVLPDDFRDSSAFRDQLDAFREAGLWGLELNVREFKRVSFSELEAVLGEHGLALSMFASGLTAKTLGLSLSALDEAERKRAVSACAEMLEWVEREDVGVILGLMKGADKTDPARALEQMQRSLEELCPIAEREQTPLILEATNRYETPIANSVYDAVELVRPYPPTWARILPDTFHMNIEELDIDRALRDCSERFSSIHFSENNRYLPGYGGFSFAAVLRTLREIGYHGRVGLEGNLRNDLVTDTQHAVSYLHEVSGSSVSA